MARACLAHCHRAAATGTCSARGRTRTLLCPECSIVAIRERLTQRSLTSLALTKYYLARMARLNPRLHAVIARNPRALQEARACDARRAQIISPTRWNPNME